MFFGYIDWRVHKVFLQSVVFFAARLASLDFRRLEARLYFQLWTSF